ncbi:SemiSWEET transporter [Nitrososphaeria virus YSH_1032793]|uniref:SemiSWEET transporter n=1 Tax=Nitrososphaeria virus YSH_1032793 TaxID=3071320 RepID=A0A976YF30_9CAUD|nr:SemiSWEET transporter [Yangshan Harbor Nitrososphaeria virus]UVF62247.1 SemiSWEET transporter [Nitrososphaeria virus YSH_1032793]
MDLLYISGIIATIMVLSGSGYQAFKIWRTKETKGLTYPLIINVFGAMILFTIFGIVIKDPVVMYGNFIGVLIYLHLLSLKICIERISSVN